MKTISRVQAREVTLKLLRLKAADHPEVLDVSGEDLKKLVEGLRKAFAGRGVHVDEDAAEGIADAVQELIPGARDGVELPQGTLWTPPRRRKLWRPN